MDISAGARQAFEKQYAYDPLPTLFVTDADGTYYLDPAMAGSTQYRQWVQFRIDTISAFMAGLADVARIANPRLPVFLTYVADVTVPGGAGKTPNTKRRISIPCRSRYIRQASSSSRRGRTGCSPTCRRITYSTTRRYVPQLHPGVVGLGQPDIRLGDQAEHGMAEGVLRL